MESCHVTFSSGAQAPAGSYGFVPPFKVGP